MPGRKNNVIKNLLRLIGKPLPAWLTLFLIMGAAAGATAILPIFATGTAAFGPGGLIDFGTADSTVTSPGPSDPTLFNKGGSNLALIAPNNQNVNVYNCTTATCNTSAQSLTAQFGAGAQTDNVPVYAVPTPVGTGVVFSPTPGPLPPCYKPNGSTCPASMHAVWGQLTATTTGVCSNNSNCALRNAGSSIGVSGNALFDTPDGAWDIACSTFAPIGYIATTGYVVVGPTIQVLTFFNAQGTAIPDGTGSSIGFYCTGP